MKNKLICVLGASGSGKDSITNALQMKKVISYRTRPIREFETNGIDGHFISKEVFDQMEHLMIAKTVYANHCYGITENELSGLNDHHLIYIIDLEGVNQLKHYAEQNKMLTKDQIVTVFIDAPETCLRHRMKKQGRSREEIERRMNQYWDIDYEAKEACDHVIYNPDGKQKQAIEQLKKLIDSWN